MTHLAETRTIFYMSAIRARTRLGEKDGLSYLWMHDQVG
jgi:hypothetical protein